MILVILFALLYLQKSFYLANKTFSIYIYTIKEEFFRIKVTLLVAKFKHKHKTNYTNKYKNQKTTTASNNMHKL